VASKQVDAWIQYKTINELPTGISKPKPSLGSFGMGVKWGSNYEKNHALAASAFMLSPLFSWFGILFGSSDT
jgi:hypothetical protein